MDFYTMKKNQMMTKYLNNTLIMIKPFACSFLQWFLRSVSSNAQVWLEYALNRGKL